MASPFLAEIRMFGGSFAPRNYAFCNGQILTISQNTALFSLLGTYYGGNGTTTFALPNLQGRAPIHPGQGPGLSPYSLGQLGGSETQTLNITQLPAHNHTPTALSTSPNPAPLLSPAGNVWAVAGGRRASSLYKAAPPGVSNMNASAIGLSGGGQPHNNRQPYLAINFIIALQGVYPARN